MHLNEYQSQAESTAIYPGRGELSGLLYVSLGLAGEAGEFCNRVKKILRDDGGVLTPARCSELLLELGDQLWYVAAAASELKAELDEVGTANLYKLDARMSAGVIRGSGDKRSGDFPKRTRIGG